jgi:hypothetical protein
MLDQTTVQNALFFRVLNPVLMGETEVSSRRVIEAVLSEFSAGSSRRRFVDEEDPSV